MKTRDSECRIFIVMPSVILLSAVAPSGAQCYNPSVWSGQAFLPWPNVCEKDRSLPEWSTKKVLLMLSQRVRWKFFSMFQTVA
jgi:hypothetical protein